MKQIGLFLIITLLGYSCSNSKNTITIREDLAVQVIIYSNKMPSVTPNRFLYAVVEIHQEKPFEENWKIQSFEINGKDFSVFDSEGFDGKGSFVYSNTIREIPEEYDSPIKEVKIVLISDTEKRIDRIYNNLNISYIF